MAVSKTWAENALSNWSGFAPEWGLGMTEAEMKAVLNRLKLEDHVLEDGFLGVMARLLALAPKQGRRALFIGLATGLEHWDGPKGFPPLITTGIAAGKFLTAAALKATPDVVENLIEDGKIDPSNLEVGLMPYLEDALKWMRLAITNPKAVIAAHGGSAMSSTTPTPAPAAATPTPTTAGTPGPTPVTPPVTPAVTPPPAPVTPTPTPAPKPTPLVTLAGFPPGKSDVYSAVAELARLESEGDHGLGLEGEANQILNALADALANDPKGLEAILPDDPALAQELEELATMDRVEIEKLKKTGQPLPLAARRFIRTLIMGYRVKHPVSATAAKVSDRWDTFFDVLPPELKPKKSGFAGILEMAKSPLGLIVLLLLAVLLCFMLSFGLGCLWVVLSILGFVGGSFMDGVNGVQALFAPYMQSTILSVNRAVVVCWVSLILFMRAENFFPSVRRHAAMVAALKPDELAKLKKDNPDALKTPEPFRQSFLTLRIICGAVALGSTILAWGSGHFNNAGVAMMLIGIWALIIVLEATNKWKPMFLPDWMRKSMERFTGYGTAIAVAAIALAVTFFAVVQPVDANRVTVLATGVTNAGIDYAASKAGVKLPPSAAEVAKCDELIRKGMLVATDNGTTLEKTCATDSARGKKTCQCLASRNDAVARQ